MCRFCLVHVARGAHARRHGQHVRYRYIWLLALSAILMAACPVITTSRGGALVAVAMVPIVLLIMLAANARGRWGRKPGSSCFHLAAANHAFPCWEQLKPRLERTFSEVWWAGR